MTSAAGCEDSATVNVRLARSKVASFAVYSKLKHALYQSQKLLLLLLLDFPPFTLYNSELFGS